jgi:DNA polymerase V
LSLPPAEVPANRPGTPLLLCPVAAGFPSPAEDYLDGELDLQKLVVRNVLSTVFLRAGGESMIGAGIHEGDLLVLSISCIKVRFKADSPFDA